MGLKNRIGTGLLGIISLMVVAGCAGPAYHVEVYMSPQLKEQMRIYPSLEVDLVGANVNEAERLETCSIDDYFSVESPMRNGMSHATMTFSEDDILPKAVSKRDEIWRKFHRKSANKLYILINLPLNEKTGIKDPRKVMIPLESSIFGSDDRFFEINSSGIIRLEERPEGYPAPLITGEKK